MRFLESLRRPRRRPSNGLEGLEMPKRPSKRPCRPSVDKTDGWTDVQGHPSKLIKSIEL